MTARFVPTFERALLGLILLAAFVFAGPSRALAVEWKTMPDRLQSRRSEGGAIVIESCGVGRCKPIGRPAGYSEEEIERLIFMLHRTRQFAPYIKGGCYVLSGSIARVAGAAAMIALGTFCEHDRLNTEGLDKLEAFLPSLLEDKVSFLMSTDDIVMIRRLLPQLLDNLEFNESAIVGP